VIDGVRYGAEITAAAQAHGVDPMLLAAVAAQETGGPGSNSGNNIVGDGGHGHGVFQIDDRTWPFASTAAAMDPAKNADMAASILADDIGRYGGNVRAALSAYNAGSPTAGGTETTWGDGQTLGYADSVLRHYDQLGSGTQAQLVADNRETAGAVNALSAYSAATPSSPGGAANASELTGATFLPPLMATFSPPPQLTFNGAEQPAANAVGAQADKDLGDLVGGDDVFDAQGDG
jgi:Transglycosylase SLT domain